MVKNQIVYRLVLPLKKPLYDKWQGLGRSCALVGAADGYYTRFERSVRKTEIFSSFLLWVYLFRILVGCPLRGMVRFFICHCAVRGQVK